MSGEQLERRYRKLLCILPKSYREAREEELLSVLMEGAAEGRQWPETREALSLVRLGVRVRLGNAGDSAQGTFRVGATVRAVAIAGTLLLTFLGVVQLAVIVNTVRTNRAASWSLAHFDTVSFQNGFAFDVTYSEVPVFWLAVLALIAVGWWRVARVLAAVLFLASACLTDGTRAALEEETVLAAVVTVALFAVRGEQTRPARVAGPAGLLVALILGAWVNGVFAPVGGFGMPVIRILMDLQAWQVSDSGHVLIASALGVGVVAVVAYRSVVWPVALAVVAVATLTPVVVRSLAHPVEGFDQKPLEFLAGALVVVAVLAVLRDRRAVRRARPASTT